jgi:hypothetical protein
MSTFLRFSFAALMFDGFMRSALPREFQKHPQIFLPYRLGFMPGHKQSGRSIKPLSRYAERLQNIAVHPELADLRLGVRVNARLAL